MFLALLLPSGILTKFPLKSQYFLVEKSNTDTFRTEIHKKRFDYHKSIISNLLRKNAATQKQLNAHSNWIELLKAALKCYDAAATADGVFARFSSGSIL